MNADDDKLLRRSFERLQDDFDRFSTAFYDRLFVHAPELRELFRDDLTGQGMKFMTTLREIILNARDPDAATRLRKLGSSHESLGVIAQHFAPMEEALIDTLRDTLGDDLTPELESAWRRAYGEISKQMIQLGGMRG